MIEFKKLKELKKVTMLLPFVLSLLFASTTFGQSVIEECVNFIDVGDYQRAIKSGQKAVEMFPDNVEANLCLGLAYGLVGELKLALEYLKRAESLTNDKGELSEIYNLLGHVLRKMGDYDSALHYYSRQLAIEREGGDKESQAIALISIAAVYTERGEYNKALEYYRQSLNLTKEDDTKALIYNQMAITYLAKRDHMKAIEYLKKTIEIKERAGDYHMVAQAYINLGLAYIIAKNYALAEKYITEGLKRVQAIGDRYWEAEGYATLGLLYIAKKDERHAIAYLTIAYNIYKAIGAKANAEKVKNALLELGVNPDKP